MLRCIVGSMLLLFFIYSANLIMVLAGFSRSVVVIRHVLSGWSTGELLISPTGDKKFSDKNIERMNVRTLDCKLLCLLVRLLLGLLNISCFIIISDFDFKITAFLKYTGEGGKGHRRLLMMP